VDKNAVNRTSRYGRYFHLIRLKNEEWAVHIRTKNKESEISADS